MGGPGLTLGVVTGHNVSIVIYYAMVLVYL